MVTAAPGYWGGGTPNVTFLLCPSGYCCDGDATSRWPCSGVSACAGHRVGRLCGDCEQGYVVGLGSALCVSQARCGGDQAVVWSLLALGVLAAALLQLCVVSNVFGYSSAQASVTPSMKVKVAIYYYQVSWPCVDDDNEKGGTRFAGMGSLGRSCIIFVFL